MKASPESVLLYIASRLLVLSRVFMYSLLLFRSALFANIALKGVCIACVRFYSAFLSEIALEGRIEIESIVE